MERPKKDEMLPHCKRAGPQQAQGRVWLVSPRAPRSFPKQHRARASSLDAVVPLSPAARLGRR